MRSKFGERRVFADGFTPCMWISLETLGAAYVGGQITEKGKTREMARSRLITTVLIAEYRSSGAVRDGAGPG